jgi:hypothetical protein
MSETVSERRRRITRALIAHRTLRAVETPYTNERPYEDAAEELMRLLPDLLASGLRPANMEPAHD